MNKSHYIKLHGNPYEPTQFLIVWKDEENTHCQCLYCKDYNTAEYITLQLIEDKGYKNVVLYKSGRKLDKSDHDYMYRVYVPVAYYNGNRYELQRIKHFCGTSIHIWSEHRFKWCAWYDDYETSCIDMKLAIEYNAERVYGRNWRYEK